MSIRMPLGQSARIPRLVSALLLSLVSIHTAQAASITLKDDAIELRGEIRKGDSDRFNELLSDGSKRVRIRSQGGDLGDALRIGQAILARQLDVEVAGLCASACAQLILPAAKSVRLDDGSIVAMHAAAHGALLSAQREGKLPEATSELLSRAFSQFDRLNEDMKTFFQASGVRMEAMDFMYGLTSISNMQVAFEQVSDDGGKLQLTGAQDPLCRAWLLDKAALLSLGIRAGEWKSAGRFKAAMILGEKYDQIYDGQVIPLEGIEPETSCAVMRRKGSLAATAKH